MRFYTKNTNYQASSMVAKCTFYFLLLLKRTPTSMPASSIKFQEILRTLNACSLSFMMTFFLVYSNSRTFSSTVKQMRMLMQSLCDFCSLHLNLLFCRISTSLKGSPILCFSWARSIKGQKLALTWLDLHPQDMNQMSFQLSTDEKVATQEGTLYISIQNLSRLLELSDSLQTRVNLSWNSMMFFWSCYRIQPYFLSRPIQAVKMCLPHLASEESESQSLSISTISFSSRSLLSVSFSQNLMSLILPELKSQSNSSIYLLAFLVQSLYSYSTACKAVMSIFQIQVVRTFRFSTSPLLSSVNQSAARSNASQMKYSLGFLLRSSLATDLQNEEQRERVSSKYLIKSLINSLVYYIFSLKSACRLRQMRVRQLTLAARAVMCCLSCSRFIFLLSEKAMWKSFSSCETGCSYYFIQMILIIAYNQQAQFMGAIDLRNIQDIVDLRNRWVQSISVIEGVIDKCY